MITDGQNQLLARSRARRRLRITRGRRSSVVSLSLKSWQLLFLLALCVFALSYLGHLFKDIVQVKTLDHKPPMTQAEFDVYAFNLTRISFLDQVILKSSTRDKVCYPRRDTPEDDHQRIFRVLFCPHEIRRQGSNYWVKSNAYSL